VKSLLFAADQEKGPAKLFMLLVRGDHELNEVKASKIPGMAESRFATEAEIKQACNAPAGYLGPVGISADVTVVADRTVANMADFVCGAIAEGMQRLGWSKRPQEIHQLQAAAAVGQMGLVQVYESCFARFNLRSAQILLTNADLADTERNANARATLDTLLKLGVVPIINENDTVVTDEIKFGDNDSLAALVTNLIHADLLVILTDQGGLFTADPRQNPNASLLSDAVAGDPALEKMAGGAASELSKGGMLTKVLAAKIAVKTGATTVIASGREPDVLTRLMAGEKIGTRLVPATE
jgi:glutamate 5-kinase